ncbi:hypothetical protein STZ1_20290 [Bacillus subtilis]
MVWDVSEKGGKQKNMNDFEQKLYQIIVNMRLYGKNLTLPALKRKPGKNEQENVRPQKALSEKVPFLV